MTNRRRLLLAVTLAFGALLIGHRAASAFTCTATGRCSCDVTDVADCVAMGSDCAQSSVTCTQSQCACMLKSSAPFPLPTSPGPDKARPFPYGVVALVVAGVALLLGLAAILRRSRPA